jgi:hypothetical protein
MLKAEPLAKFHIAQASEHRIPVTHINYFVPDDRKGVCVSLEEWGAKIFEPDIPQILHDAKKADKQTKIRFKHSKKLKGRFSFTGEDLSKNVKDGDDKKNGGGTISGVGTSYDSSPDQHQGQPREKLLFNISCGIKLLLSKFEENTKKKKRKIKQGEQDENEIAQTAALSLLVLVNMLDESNKFNRLDEMQNHMSKKITEQRGDLQAANKEESVKINRDKKKFSQFE